MARRGRCTPGVARLPSLPDPAKGGRGEAGGGRRRGADDGGGRSVAEEDGGQRRRSHLPDPAGGPPIPDPEASWGRTATAAACSSGGRRSSAALPSPRGSGGIMGRAVAEAARRRRPKTLEYGYVPLVVLPMSPP
uniref:Uncharacterized protein n=1 Tax=Oryza sativa subsp. japonica TaxID=39947 RepID=Q8H512_ORYSJ|nr:hypothetical protein [Oryza sativa Japonica Group]BAD30419.1 hypothetical protein [Oryza sativa Japonica Group]